MILVVDDHLDLAKALVIVLRRSGVEASCIHNPRETLDTVRKLRPKLVVLDQMMPEMQGTEVLRAIRSTPEIADTPAIFLSASHDGLEEAEDLGAIEWLIKGRTDWMVVCDHIVAAYRKA